MDKALIAHELGHAIQGLMMNHQADDPYTGLIQLGEDSGLSLGAKSSVAVDLAGPVVHILMTAPERLQDLATAFLANPFNILEMGQFMLKDTTDFTQARHLSDLDRKELTPELRAMVHFHSSLVAVGFYDAATNTIDDLPDSSTVLLNPSAVVDNLLGVYESALDICSTSPLFNNIEGIKALAASLEPEEYDESVATSAAECIMKPGDHIPEALQEQLARLSLPA